MSDIENLLANVPSEGGDVNFFAPNEEQTGDETTSEETADPEENQNEGTPSPTADEKSDEQSLPFHKHPRWKEMYDSKKRLESEVTQLREELETRFREVQQQVIPQSPEPIPDRFVKLYGDNPEAYRLWKEQQEELLSQAEQRAVDRIKTEQSQESRALQEGANYVENSLQELEAEGKEFDRNELMKFMLDFKEKFGAMPSDAEDNIDFHKGYDLFMTMKGSENKARSRARKDLAAFSGASGSGRGEETTKEYLTSQDLKSLDWDTLIGR